MKADQVEIFYNPFLIQTTIVVNGDKAAEDAKLHSLCRDRRLQEWIDPLLPLLQKTLANKRIDFTFHGLPLDADDLKSAIESYNRETPGAHYELVSTQCLDPDKDRLEELRKLFAEGMSGPCKKDFSQKLAAPFEKALNPTFEVHVIATMSAGKSTVINAMLGSELLASANGACTAVVTRVEDHPNLKHVTARRFNRARKPLGPWKPASRQLLESWNKEADLDDDGKATSTIVVKGCFPSISKDRERQLVFIDTPGPNSARHPQHRKVTYDAINSDTTSMVMFVIDKDITNNADELLDVVSKAMSRGGRRIHDRFVFLYNKIDDFRDKGSGANESIKSALEGIRSYLEEKFKIRNPLVIPTSALTALSLRKRRNGETLSFDEETDLDGFTKRFLHSEEFYNAIAHVSGRLNSLCLTRLYARLAAADSDEKVELFSGIPIVEEVFNDYLRKYAIPTRISEAVESFKELDRTMAVTQALNDNLSRSAEELDKSCKMFEVLQEERKKTEFGLELESQLSDWRFNLSKTTVEKLEKLCQYAESLRDSYKRQFDELGSVSTERATSLLEKALEECISADSSVEAALKSAFKAEGRRFIEEMSGHCKEYIEQVLKKEFVNEPELRNLHLAVMNLPTVAELESQFSQKYVDSFTERVYDPEFLRPWTWFVKKEVRHETVRHEIHLGDSKVQKFLRDSCAKSLRDVDEFKKDINRAVEAIRQSLLQTLKAVGPKLEALSKELRSAQLSKATKTRMMKTNQEKLDWYNSFKEKVQAILKVY